MEPWRYDQKMDTEWTTVMRYVLVLLTGLLLANPAFAERLPNQAKLDNGTPTNGPGKTLSSNEMASLYLQSPDLVSNSEQKNGIDSATKEDRYASPDQLFMAQHQDETMPHSNSTPPPKPEPPAGFLTSLVPLLSSFGQGR
jgi:hypothetical protein